MVQRGRFQSGSSAILEHVTERATLPSYVRDDVPPPEPAEETSPLNHRTAAWDVPAGDLPSLLATRAASCPAYPPCECSHRMMR